MLLDFEVQRCTRRCAVSGRELVPGDVFFSVLAVEGAEVVRHDYCREAWTGAPGSALGWWKTTVPSPTAKKIKLAPNDVLLQLFDELADRIEQQDLRYVLTLLLIRRRVLRLDMADDLAIDPAANGNNSSSATNAMTVYCPKRDATYLVPVSMPDSVRIDAIQEQLSELLLAGAE
jgi:hypothetical protein